MIAADILEAFRTVEGKVLIPVVFSGQADAKIGNCIPHCLKMKGFVIENDAVKIEDDRSQH
jgi:hypothetical protein